MARLDLTGEVFGFLTVLGRDPYLQGGHLYWKCRCACGINAFVENTNLRRGRVTTCGRECPNYRANTVVTGRKRGGPPLSTATVAAIRAMHAKRKPSYRALAEEFGVSTLTILKIVNNQTHKQRENAKGKQHEHKARSYYQ